MIKEFFSFIENQMSSKFTGKLNLTLSDNEQYLGHISILNGHIHYCTFKSQQGLRAFYAMAYEYSLGKCELKPEAEIIDENIKNIHFPFSVLVKKTTSIINSYIANNKSKPPMDIMLEINSEFIDSEEELNQDEFETLLEIKKYPKVQDLFKKSYFTEMELINNLVTLRKKKAVAVYK